MTGVYVWLKVGQKERVDALVGAQKRSEFIRDAVEVAVTREMKRRARDGER